MVKLHFFAESYDDRYQFAVYTRQVSHVVSKGLRYADSFGRMPERAATVNRFIALSLMPIN